MLEDAQQNRVDKYTLLKALDELEDNVDRLIAQMAPERITDTRFEATLATLKDIAKGFYRVRKLIVAGRYAKAMDMLARLHEVLRHGYRTMTLVKAGAPTPVVYQMSSSSSALVPPDALLEANPAATKLYNMLVRRGEVDLAEASRELGLTAEVLNEAVNTLIKLGYAKAIMTPDGRWRLRAVR
jgi:hypothetical protein